MRVYDFDVKCIAIFKAETHAPLVVDTNTLLSGAITLSALDYLRRHFSYQIQSILFWEWRYRMKTESTIKYEGMKVLRDKLGLVDSEKFISLILKEPSDYTKSRKKLFEGMSLDDIYNSAKKYYYKKNK